MPGKKKETVTEPESKKKKVQENTLPDGSILDLDTLPIGDVKLTEREKRFVFWYTYPGSDAFQNQTKSAVKAGYSQKTAVVQGCQVRTKGTVANAVKKIMDTKVKADLEEEYHKIIEMKKRRVHFDIADYVEKKKRTVLVGKGNNEHEVTLESEDFKDILTLTPEQRQAIDGIEYQGTQAMRVVIFANREKAMNDLIALYQKVNGPVDENAYDFEATAEIIKGQLAVKVMARKKKNEIAEAADFVHKEGRVIEEL
ncbi:MAG: terminase small subunit [Treponema sp.]|jgi:phage terminase small subunit|nr:terminase small subunit [Treponema sp.]